MALQFSKVMLPFDLERDPPEALDMAVEIAAGSGGEVVLVHVVPARELDLHRSIYRPEEGGGANPDWACKVAGEELEKIGKSKLGDKVKWSCEVRTGEPADRMTEIVTEKGIDLLIIPKHRERAALAEWLLGSTTYQVVRNVPCTTIVLK